MNHIRQLKIEKLGAEIELGNLLVGLQELKTYLFSDKFREDTTVQVKDVLLRLDAAISGSQDARVQYDNAAYSGERARDEAYEAKQKSSCERCGHYGKDWEIVDLQILCRKCRD